MNPDMALSLAHGLLYHHWRNDRGRTDSERLAEEINGSNWIEETDPIPELPIGGVVKLGVRSPSSNRMSQKKLKITVVEDWSSLDALAKMRTSSWLHQGSYMEPVRNRLTEAYGPNSWVYRDVVFRVDDALGIPEEELALRIKLARAKLRSAAEPLTIERLRRNVEAIERLEKHPPSARRERIPESVKMFVWRRDHSRCVQCGSNELLEFDHIIPVVEGGSNTERNIQLLCESCNRKKGRRI